MKQKWALRLLIVGMCSVAGMGEGWSEEGTKLEESFSGRCGKKMCSLGKTGVRLAGKGAWQASMLLGTGAVTGAYYGAKGIGQLAKKALESPPQAQQDATSFFMAGAAAANKSSASSYDIPPKEQAASQEIIDSLKNSIVTGKKLGDTRKILKRKSDSLPKTTPFTPDIFLKVGEQKINNTYSIFPSRKNPISTKAIGEEAASGLLATLNTPGAETQARQRAIQILNDLGTKKLTETQKRTHHRFLKAIARNVASDPAMRATLSSFIASSLNTKQQMNQALDILTDAYTQQLSSKQKNRMVKQKLSAEAQAVTDSTEDSKWHKPRSHHLSVNSLKSQPIPASHKRYTRSK